MDRHRREQRAQRRAHRSLASGRSGAQKLTDGGATERGKLGELGSSLTGEAAALGERAAQAGGEGNRSGERCGEARGGCSPFIRDGEAPGRGGRGVKHWC
jgi:hypothetical protein